MKRKNTTDTLLSVTRWFTFGCGQPNAGKYHVVTARNEGDCRAEMFRRFGVRGR